MAVRLGVWMGLIFLVAPAYLSAQVTQVGDLVESPGSGERFLVGYGIVAGLSGTGDRATGRSSSGNQTVQSISQLLRNFGLEIPEHDVRSRNTAAVLVTARIREGAGRGSTFDVEVSSIGDARSLDGGVLWQTPLTDQVQGEVIGLAQGPLKREGADRRARRSASARVPGGGRVLDRVGEGTNLPSQLNLKHADLESAVRIRDVIIDAYGEGSATLVDLGTIDLDAELVGDGSTLLEVLALPLDFEPEPTLLLRSATGEVSAVGRIELQAASATAHGVHVNIGGDDPEGLNPGDSIHDLLDSLAELELPSGVVSDILLALRQAGAFNADLQIR